MQTRALNPRGSARLYSGAKVFILSLGNPALGHSKFKEIPSPSLLMYLKSTADIDNCNNFFSLDECKESVYGTHKDIGFRTKTFRQKRAFPSIPRRTNTTLRVRACNMRWCLSIVTW